MSKNKKIPKPESVKEPEVNQETKKQLPEPKGYRVLVAMPKADETTIKIRAVNTGGRFVSKFQTPGGNVVYEGATSIDGVPGTAAPIALQFLDITGSKTGKFLPTGNPRDIIDGVEVTCMDVTMPVVIGRAVDFGISGYEGREQLDSNETLFAKMEAIRLQAAKLMGLGDVKNSVAPKFALFAPPKQGGAICVRYFMPWQTHPTLAVTSSQCLAACVLTPGTVADGVFDQSKRCANEILFEHPMGFMSVKLDFYKNAG